MDIFLLIFSLLPGQNLVDFAQDDEGPAVINFWQHGPLSVSPQARQANQGRSLLLCG
jgi:hypothetical protein